MIIAQLTKSDYNIYSDRNAKLTVKATVLDPIAPPVMTQAGPPPSGGLNSGEFRPMTPLTEQLNLTSFSFADSTQYSREAFYKLDSTLQGYVPGNGNIITEIAKAIRTGYGVLDENGEISQWFNDEKWYFSDHYVSPLNFELQLNNLRSLYESLGSEASKYDTEFDAALDEVINRLFTEGGVYVSADKAGVSDSIRSIFRGEQGKYNIDDIKAMVVLSEQRLIGEHINDPNELVLGALLGYEASAIVALHSSGKLSDNAFNTVWKEFNSFVDDVIRRASEYENHAKKDPFRNKNLYHSPISGQMVREAISVMLDASKSGDYNTEIRKAFDTLDEIYKRHSIAQAEDGILDQRFNKTTFYWHFGGPMGSAAQHNSMMWSTISSHFSQYFSLPGFELQGSLFGKVDGYI